MSGEGPENLARLRAALASVEGDGQQAVDAERIFDALHGTLQPEERRSIVDELVSNADAAHAWRLARELDPEPDARHFARIRKWRWPAAAGIVLAAGIAWQLSGPTHDPTQPVYRNVESRSIASALPPEATLTRALPVLRWTGVPGARYRVRVLTSALEVLAVSPESDAAEYRLSDETLHRIDPGSDILWQVEGRISGDTVIVSPTFRARVD